MPLCGVILSIHNTIITICQKWMTKFT